MLKFSKSTGFRVDPKKLALYGLSTDFQDTKYKKTP